MVFAVLRPLMENKRTLLLSDGPNVVEWKEWRRSDDNNSFLSFERAN